MLVMLRMNTYSYVKEIMVKTHSHHHTDNINPVPKHDLLDEVRAADLAALLKAMGDTNRIRIISLLMTQELCVHDISGLLDLSQSAVSHQMRTLRQMRLVRARREGRHMYYALDDDHVRQLFAVGLAHVDEG